MLKRSNIAIRKSELYSSLWQSCGALGGGMDASPYKRYRNWRRGRVASNENGISRSEIYQNQVFICA